MEKEMMFEEMTTNGLCCIACEMCDETLENGKFVKAECLESGHTNNCSISKHVAEAFIDAGYRKVPEGAVVLTKEELEQRDKEIKELKIANNNLIFQLQCHDDEVQRLMKENGKLRFERDFAQKIVRKETAKEYHDKFAEVIRQRDYVKGYAEIGMNEENDEILKSFGVEVEE